jgi:hypothetical protein
MAEENKVLQLIYSLFLGLLLAIFIGVGVSTFYPGPKSPEYPVELNTYGKELTDEQTVKQRDFDQQIKEYDEKMKPYNRNVSIITLSAAVLLLAISLFLEKRNIKVIADGVMIGGLFTLIYSLGRGFAAQDSKYSFVVITIGLAIVLYLGYHRFVRSHNLVSASSAKSGKKK